MPKNHFTVFVITMTILPVVISAFFMVKKFDKNERLLYQVINSSMSHEFNNIESASTRWIALYNGFGKQGYKLGVAFSDELTRNWVIDENKSPITSPINVTITSSPKVIEQKNGYMMYATGRNKNSHTYLWLSLNGVDWELYSNSPVLHFVAVGAVHHDPNDQSQPFKLWGLKKNSNGITYFHSVDGIHWVENEAILEIGDSGTWDEKKITPQAIYEENGTWHLFYEGRDHQNFMQGGVAIADHPNGPYTKHRANPIIRRQPDVDQRLSKTVRADEFMLFVENNKPFVIGMPIAIFDGKGNWEFNRVEGLYQTDTVKLAKPLRQIYSVENRARVRSWAWAKVYPTNVWKVKGTWYVFSTCFDPYKGIYSGIMESTGLASGSSLDNLNWDYEASPILPMGSNLDNEWDYASRENISIVRNIRNKEFSD